MNRIRELRLAKGWLQKDLAVRMNIGIVSVSRYELEQRQLDPETIIKLCDIFEVTADYLLCRSNIPNVTLSESDADLITAYHAADENIRKAIDALLFPAEAPGDRSAVS